MMNTGFLLPGFPCMGAWISYALGALSNDLPDFVVLPDVRGLPYNQRGNFGAGFLPARQGERKRALEALRSRTETLVWFEAPHRLRESLEDAAVVLGPRRASVARELTKLHEEVVRGTLPEVAEIFRARGAGRGEVTVVVEGASESFAIEHPTTESVDEKIREALAAGEALKRLSKEIARRAGRPAREIYSRALQLSKQSEPDPE